ncbi:MAG: hypothetical protein K8I27_15505 [Planctomycetes bacterium]|nr:hypothetical protein [Planctomycetota bacterium]
MRTYLCLLLALALLVSGGCERNQANSSTPESTLVQRYLDEVNSDEDARHVASFSPPNFPGVFRFSIPNNSDDFRERWCVDGKFVAKDEVAPLALQSRGWAKLDQAQRMALAVEWIEATETALLQKEPAGFPSQGAEPITFTAPEKQTLPNGDLVITGWQQRVVDFGAAGGTRYFVSGKWVFTASGAMSATWGAEHFAR